MRFKLNQNPYDFKKEPLKYHMRDLWKNRIILWLYILLPSLLVFGFYFAGFAPFGILILEILGIYFLYIDEKFKHNDSTMKYAKFYTFLLMISDPISRIDSCKRFIKKMKNPPKDHPDMVSKVSTHTIGKTLDKQIENKLNSIREGQELMKEILLRLDVIESDNMKTRDFSFLRKTGYIFLGLGFILQFISNIQL